MTELQKKPRYEDFLEAERDYYRAATEFLIGKIKDMLLYSPAYNDGPRLLEIAKDAISAIAASSPHEQ